MSRVSTTRAPYVYELVDLLGEELDGIFYGNELSLVRKKNLNEDRFYVDEVLRERGTGRSKECFVSFIGWPAKFNAWIPARNIIDI